MIARPVLCAILACAGCSNAPRAAAEGRPNILWIVGENLKLDLGCYGAEHVRTPNLDALAAAGVRYTRVFSTSPVCAPSRSAFMTGLYQTTTDTHPMRSHRSDDFRLPPGVRPITHWLQDAGYFTANVTRIGDRVVGTGKLDLNFVNEGPIYRSADWSALRANPPFFAQVNTPEVEYDIYDRKSGAKARVEWVGEREHPRVATPENVAPPPYYPDHRITREEWARYLNSVSGLDRRVGWILEELEKDGLADDTVVIFFADNGRLEARGIHWCYDTGLHVPMIVRWPKNFPAPPQIRPGTENGQVISLIDVTATTLAIAGIPRPPGMQGRVFLGDRPDAPRTYAFSARDRIDETVNRIRSVRDARYRYIRNYMPEQGFASLNRYKEKCFLVQPLMRELQRQGKLSGPAADLLRPLPPEQLFDTQVDPHEIRNLAGSDRPEHRDALARLRAALDVWIAETGDRGERPEPADVVAPFEKEMHDWFGTPAWAAPVRVVFDTDMDGDCDDVAALALLHVLADRGEAEILATVTSTRSAATPSCVDAINTYYGRGGLPVGAPKEGLARPSKYADAVARACPHDLKSVATAEDAVEVYRRVLEAQPDGSVVVVTVGFHTNVAALLRSPGGPDLVRRKVKEWVCMGGNFIGKPAKDDLKLGNVNFVRDAAASYYALGHWPGRVTFVGREVASVPSGLKVGSAFARLPEGHPVRLAYEAYFGGTCKDRHVADPAAVLYAVRGLRDYWDLEDRGRLALNRDMTFEWTYDRDGDQAYLLKKQVDGTPSDRLIEKTIEDLVLTPPRARGR